MSQTILLIDDSSFNESCLLDSLARNLRIQQARNASEAFSSLEEFCPDIVLIDTKIPGEKSQDILSFIEESYPETIVILLSEMTDSFYSQFHHQKGAHFRFDKTRQTELIKETVRQLVN